jgi:predicted TIM-barrel fold metal-dependent hydrolase
MTMEYIDAHVHVWTPDIERYPLMEGRRREDMKPPSFTPEELFRHCRPSGVSRIVLVQMSFYGFDNSYMLEAMRQHPGTFSGIARVDWTGTRPEEAMLRLAEHGVRGFRIQPQNAPVEQWVETASFRRMFQAAAEHGLAMCPLIGTDALPSLERMCREFPRTTVVIDHLCRIGNRGPIRDEDVDALCRMAAYPGVKVKVSAFYALGEKKPPHDELAPLIRRVRDAFGARRLMWASDCPFAVQNERYEDSIGLVRDRLDFLTAEDKEWILEKTAAETFF